jgi:hypothetical protein
VIRLLRIGWIVATAVICLVLAAFFSTNRIVDAIAGIPLVTIIPGAAAISSWKQSKKLALPESALWIVLISLGITVSGGLLLNLIGGLTRRNWLVFIGVFVAICFVLRLVQNRSGANHDSSDRTRSVRARAVALLRTKGFGIVMASVILVSGAVVVSYLSANATRERFVQLWMIPSGHDPSGAPLATIGIKNQEGSNESFKLSIYGEKSKGIVDRMISLKNGEEWTAKIVRPSRATLRATLTVRHTNGQGTRPQVVSLPAKGG